MSEIAAWLKQHGVKVSVPTISRALARIRAAAPAVVIAVPELAPATEEDDLAVVRKAAREDMKEGEWRKRQGAMGLLLRVAELRRKVQPVVPTQSAAKTSSPTTPPQSELTTEQEAAAVRAQLGKMN